MATRDQTFKERRSEYNSNVELFNKNTKEKFAKAEISKFNKCNNLDSNFERSKKLGLLRRNTAQDRLKRIRSNVDVKKKIQSKIKKNQYSEENCKQSKKSYVLQNKFLSNKGNFKYNLDGPFRTEKYSADARLKKIRTIASKTTSVSEHIEKTSATKNNDIILSPILKTTYSKNYFENESNPANVPQLNNQIAEKPNCSNVTVKLVEESDVAMDVDLVEYKSDELPKILDSNSALNNCSPATPKHAKNDPKDWENVTEWNISFVNEEISKIRQDPMYQALHENFMPDVEMNLTLPVGDLFIVIDTNMFLSHLHFLTKLLNYKILPYRSPVMVVPWLVIQEIDYAMKKDNSRLSSQARLANTFINDCLKKKHPRFFGQSLADFKENFKNAVCIDDYILQYCLKLVSLRNTVILLTDDINLCNKSMVNQLTVFTKKEFEKTFIFI